MRIKEVTGKVVSETTLKRFLGFAKKNYNFSAYTLNALCDYIGFSGWEAFKDSIEPGLTKTRSANDIWFDFHQKSREVSFISRQSIEDHSGIPFQYTVSRSSIETDFEIFMEEDYSCFGLIGVAGMGKSIQMVHLAEQFFLSENAQYKNSILWLFKRGALFDFIPHDIYLEETLYEQFGLRSEFNFIDYFRKNPDEVPGHLVLMMDGFDDYLQNTDHREKAFRQFSDLLSYLRDIKWVKLVFSLRPETWTILNSMMQSSAFLRKSWFPGLSYQSKLNTNIVHLLPAELDKVFDQSPFHKNNSQRHLYALLRYPVFLTSYFQQLERNELPDSNIGDVLFFKLISYYLGDRVHRAGLDLEKWFLIKKMLGLSISDNGYSNCVKEAELLSGYFDDSNHVIAYRELLQCGLLQRKQDKSRNEDKMYSVCFVDKSLYVYLLFHTVVDKEKDISIKALLTKVKKDFHDVPNKILLLKSIYWHLLERRSQDIFEPLYSDFFEVDEKAELILFIIDYIHSFPLVFSKDKIAVFCKEVITFFANHLFYIDRLNEVYNEAIKYLLEICESDLDKMNLLTIRGILSVLSLDQRAMQSVIDQMNQIQKPAFRKKYPVQPVEMMHHLFDVQKTEWSQKDVMPVPLASFVENNSAFQDKTVSIEILLAYQLTGLILQTCLAKEPFLAFCEKIWVLHAASLKNKDFPELQTLLELQEIFSLDAQMNISAKHIEKYLNHTPGVKNTDTDTDTEGNSYFSIFLLLLKGDSLLKNDQVAAATCFREAYELCRLNHYELLQIVIALRLIKRYKNGVKVDYPEELTRVIRQKTVHLPLSIKEVFLQKAMVEVD